MRQVRAAAVAAACFAHAPAVSAQTVNDGQLWADLYVSAPVAKGLLLSGEAISRTVDDIGREGQVETRLEVGHAFNKRVTGWVGWVHFTTFAPSGPNGIENHAVEQLNWTPGKLGKVLVALRTRVEQRAIRGVGEISWRAREQARFVLPLTGSRLALVLWGEPFVAVNRTRAQPELLERVRSFAGVNLPVARHLEIEAGYLNEYLPRPSGDRDNHALNVIANIRL